LLKAQLAKFEDLSGIAINAMREEAGNEVIRASFLIAKVIADWIESGKKINAELLIENKPKWAKNHLQNSKNMV